MPLEQEDIDPDQADTKSGRTPLSWAAKRRYEEVVKMLLEREDVNPNTVEKERGCTPLSWAAGRRETRVMKVLWGEKTSTRTRRTRNRAERRSRGRLSADMGVWGQCHIFLQK